MDGIESAAAGFADIGLNVLKAAIFLAAGWWLSRIVARVIRIRVLATDKLDDTLGVFVASIARYLILIVTVIAVLQVFGFQATSLVAVLGAATLAIGLALQGTLGHLAAGVMLIAFRPYSIGDFVDISGHSGTVKFITLFTTEIATPDNVQIIVPNGNAWGSAIVNYSANDTRRVNLTIGIGYDDDADKAIAIMRALVSADERVNAEPETFIAVTNLGDSSVDVTLRAWCAAGDYWGVKFDLTKAIKDAFDQEEISIPYPHMQVVGVPAA
jgi:small conductance mechanosensitive channel